jgi:hypothetical protein
MRFCAYLTSSRRAGIVAALDILSSAGGGGLEIIQKQRPAATR